jgi:transposase
MLDRQIAKLDKEIARRAREDEVARRLMTIPGIGPITATASLALAPPSGTFAKGRDFAAWVGLTPRQHSTGGKRKLGSISKMGERTLRRLLIIGSSAVVLQASKRGARRGSWLEQMLVHRRHRHAGLLLLDLEAAEILRDRGVRRASQPCREPPDVADIVALGLA